MAEQAQEHGATIQCDTMFLDATQKQDGRVSVEVGKLSAKRTAGTPHHRHG